MFNILLSIAKEGSSSNDALPTLGTPGRSGRDGLIVTVYKQHRARAKILEPYRRMKSALKLLQEEYLQSKERNTIMRYIRLSDIVSEVAFLFRDVAVLLEKQYWKLLEIPTQQPAEDQHEYVARVINILDEKGSEPPSARSGGIGALLSTTILDRVHDNKSEQSMMDAIKSRKTDELQRDCETMYDLLYKLIRKYLGLKRILRDLNLKFESTRHYPIVPRYTLLKKMIKSALRAPEFAEICHEQQE